MCSRKSDLRPPAGRSSRGRSGRKGDQGLDPCWFKGTRRRIIPKNLSGGEQQRVGDRPGAGLGTRLMLWDEPTAALDPILVGEVLEIMEELVKK